MSISIRGFAAVFAILLGAVPAAAATCDAAYVETVEPLLAKRCVACHNKASPGSGLTLQKGTGYAALVDVPSTQAKDVMRVAPGDPEASYLFRKLVGTQKDVGGSGVRMPIGGKLTDTEIALVETWILGCAPEGAPVDGGTSDEPSAPSEEPAASSEAPSAPAS